jgi:mannose-6-phosphate isomerase-like protein (cupin superfamily)
MSQSFIVHDRGAANDGWDEPEGRGVVGWQTLLSSDTTPTEGLTAGIAVLEPGGHLAAHRHNPVELYFLLEGEGIITLDGVEHRLGKGACVFIPGNAEHGIRNDGATRLRFFYVFPTDGFPDVEYRFSRRR